jgi:hypothetical protein
MSDNVQDRKSRSVLSHHRKVRDDMAVGIDEAKRVAAAALEELNPEPDNSFVEVDILRSERFVVDYRSLHGLSVPTGMHRP